MNAAGSALLLTLRIVWRPALALALIALLVVWVRPARLVQEVEEFRDWLDGFGLWGVVIFLALYMFATVAIVPVSLLKVAAGVIYGSFLGVILATAGATLGAGMCFLIARQTTRGPLAVALRRKEKFRRLESLTDRHGAVVVALVRLVPVLPGNIVNYAFGLLRLRLETYLLWTLIGSLPSTVVLVVGTDAIIQGIRDRRTPWELVVIASVALALLVAAGMVTHRVFKRRQARNGAAAGAA